MNVTEILKNYRLGQILEVQSWKGGTANENYRIVTERGTYFVKWRVPRLSNVDNLRFTHLFLHHMKLNGLPFHEPVLPKWTGRDHFVIVDGRLLDVTPFIEGNQFDGSSEEVIETGSVLARLHIASSTFKPPIELKKKRPLYESHEQIEESMKLARSAFAHRNLKRVKQTFREALNLLEDEFYPVLESILDKGVIHGDYHPRNMLFDDDRRIRGIFDADAASEQILIRDLVDGLIYFARKDPGDMSKQGIIELARSFEFDLGRMRLFLETYNGLRLLEAGERVAIPLMLRQRWLGIKLDPIRLGKVSPEEALILLEDADKPLLWLDENQIEVSRLIFNLKKR